VEEEIKRLGKIAKSGVSFTQSTVGGLRAHRLSLESERASSNPDSPKLVSATIEYIVDTTDATFLVTASCTDDEGGSCMPGLERLGQNIEADLRF